MTTKTPEQIAGTAVHEWLNEYTWPFSERREFSATELADAVEGLIVAAIEADRAQRHHWDAEIYIVQNDVGDVVDVFRDAGEATAAYQDGYSIIQETVWEPGEYAEQRIRTLTAAWEESTNRGADEPHRASGYALSEDDWRAGLDDEEAAEIARLIEWKEEQK